jgi:Queuine tRNA-ribosyltransferase
MAHHWEEEPNDIESVTPMTLAVETKRLKMAERNRQREAHATANNGGVPVPKKIEPVVEVEEFKSGGSGNSAKQMKSLKMVREHINLCKSRMRNDPRPIDSTCGCYTCKGYSRAYLHHLFKAKETLGGTLVSTTPRLEFHPRYSTHVYLSVFCIPVKAISFHHHAQCLLILFFGFSAVYTP